MKENKLDLIMNDWQYSKISAFIKALLKLMFFLMKSVSDCSGNPFLIRHFGEVKKIETKGAPAFWLERPN